MELIINSMVTNSYMAANKGKFYKVKEHGIIIHFSTSLKGYFSRELKI